jgi:hypothetical protein
MKWRYGGGWFYFLLNEVAFWWQLVLFPFKSYYYNIIMIFFLNVKEFNNIWRKF